MVGKWYFDMPCLFTGTQLEEVFRRRKVPAVACVMTKGGGRRAERMYSPVPPAKACVVDTRQVGGVENLPIYYIKLTKPEPRQTHILTSESNKNVRANP